ncbi:Plasmin and fibronectin-binding protein A precursor [Streptomyces sp. YIM 121038]|uniref:right-handed parallel beta-helix repeat-containing protein n=1 Tax=Streptomyces sp. YIM 121038 TaxID=2136401 RepID=UPI001162822C|nr:right-handed parallel beta-helix repeat-containing protein [Streptomyces sp. YIM 121038]QCX81039.1 Plasmin and fibronectin-binding protein A precursor [Streptomyces sp. YIM 121038]
MALYTYGGTPADVLTTVTGDVVPDYPVLVRRAGTGELVTALYEEDGTTPISELRSNPVGSGAPGAIRTFKADSVTAIQFEYLDGEGDPVRWYAAAREAATGALDQLEAKVDKSGSTLTGKLQWGMANSTDVALGSFKVADAFDRWRMTADGAMAWGSGAAARDTFLSRSAAGVLETPGTFVAGQVSLSGMRLFNVRIHGATGGGTVDDAPFIQAAFDAAQAAGGGWVIIPPGDYRLATLPLRIWGKTRLTLLPGARMLRAADSTVLTNGAASQNLGGYTGHGDLVIEGGTWEMRGTTSGLTASRMCISLGHAQRILIRDTEVRDTPGFHALEINACKNIRVENCRFLGYIDPGSRPFSEAIQPDLAKGSAYFGAFGPYDHTPVEDLTVTDCYFGASGTAGTVPWPRGVGSHSATIGRWHKRIKVIGNTFEGGAQYAVGGYNWQDPVVEGNTITGCGAGVRMRTVDTADTEDTKNTSGTQTSASQAARNFTIVGNTITGTTGYDDCIVLQGEATGRIIDATIDGNILDGNSAGGQNGIRIEYADDYTIGDNTIRDTAGTGISQEQTSGGTVTGNRVRGTTGSGIACTTCSEIEIADNTMRELGVNGIHVLGGTDVTIVDNYIKGASRAAAGSWGIRASTSSDGLLITGNKIRKYGSGNEVANGIGITNTCTNVRRYGNDLGDTGIDDQSTGPETTPYDTVGALEELMRPAGRFETTSRLRCGTSSSAMTSGVLYLVPIWLPKGAVISNLSFVTGGTGVGTPTNYWFTLHDRSRVALARTADQTTAAWAANTTKTLAIAQTTAGSASTYTTTYAGLYYLGIMIKATTMPTIVGEGSMTAGASSSPGFGDTNTGQTTPPTVTSGAFTAAAFGGNTGLLAYGYTT